ncbi:hypothetical protein WAI453_005395 [Rhynchosporium graminicola]|nr:uncharacterized protein RSE6_06810 [Rhynchosporium secalis]
MIVPAQEKLSKEELAKDKISGEPFMPWAEICLHREQTSGLLYRVYKTLMREPVEQEISATPAVKEALIRRTWNNYTRYQQRLIKLHADDIMPRFSGPDIVQEGWLPTGMISMFSESRFQWKD